MYVLLPTELITGVHENVSSVLIYICSQLKFGYLCMHHQHSNGLSFSLRNFLSWLHASVQGQIKQYVSKLLSAPQDEDALSFWQKHQAS